MWAVYRLKSSVVRRWGVKKCILHLDEKTFSISRKLIKQDAADYGYIYLSIDDNFTVRVNGRLLNLEEILLKLYLH